MAATDNLEKRIDTNKKNGMEPQEIINFLKNDENVQELGKRLTQECKDTFYFRFNQRNLKFYNAILNTTLNNYSFQEKIRNKIKKGVGGLTKTDVFLLYLQCTIDAIRTEKSYNIPTITKSNDIYTRYGGQTLLRYIRTQYNNPRYEFWKGWPKPEQRTPPKTKISHETPKKVTQLPTDIDFYTHGENNTYMPREFKKLDTWTQQNFLAEYNKEKQASTKRNRYKNGIENYVQYDLYLFSLKKYQEFIEKKHTEIINQIYGSTEIYNKQQELSERYSASISILEEDFPNIQKTIEKLSEYNNELEKIQKKYLGKTNEEILQKKYNEYVSEVEKKGIEMGIKDINESFKKEPKTKEEAVKFFENINKVEEFQTEQERIRNKHGKSIDNYENYMKAKGDLIKKYGKNNLKKWIETYKKYIKEVEHYKVQNFDIGKYQEYTKKIQNTGLIKHYENLRILYDNITIKDGNVPKNFPIQGIKDDYDSMKAKQAETDARWENLKKKSIIIYQICNIGARGLNALRSSTVGTGAKLGALILSPLCDDDERIALWEKTETGFRNLHFNMSSNQSKSVYEDGKITFNRNNGPGVIADSIVNMYTLIYGGGAIKQGLVKGAGKAGVTLGTKGINTAGKIGLFSSGFLQQVGTTFQEGFNAGMTGNQALLYCTISATIQGGLELVSPNEILLGGGKGLAKGYIKELLKSGEKGSIKAIGKLFLKNVGAEIGEEISQESLQLAAGNLINMRANDQFDLGLIAGTEKLDADRNRKNFGATALVTALTTGLVTGGSYTMQTPGIGNNQNREQLIQCIQNNPEIHSNVMNVLDKAIAGKIKIPNIDIQKIQDLKSELSGDEMAKMEGNTNNGNLNGDIEEAKPEHGNPNPDTEKKDKTNCRSTTEVEILSEEENETSFKNNLPEFIINELEETGEITQAEKEHIEKILKENDDITTIKNKLKSIINHEKFNKLYNEYKELYKSARQTIYLDEYPELNEALLNEILKNTSEGIKEIIQEFPEMKSRLQELITRNLTTLKKYYNIDQKNIDKIFLLLIEREEYWEPIIKGLKELGYIKSIDDVIKLGKTITKDVYAKGIEELTININTFSELGYIKSIDDIIKLRNIFVYNVSLDWVKTNLATLTELGYIKTVEDIAELDKLIRTGYETTEKLKKFKELGYIKSIDDLVKLTDMILGSTFSDINVIKGLKELGYIKSTDDLAELGKINGFTFKTSIIKKIEILNNLGISHLSLYDIINIPLGYNNDLNNFSIFFTKYPKIEASRLKEFYYAFESYNFYKIFNYFGEIPLSELSEYINIITLKYDLPVNLKFKEGNHKLYIKYIDRICKTNYDSQNKGKIIEKICSLPTNKIETYINILELLDCSISTDIQRIKNELIDELIETENPEKNAQIIINIFERNNLPLTGKVFKIFELLYPIEKFKDILNPTDGEVTGSPVLNDYIKNGKNVYELIYRDLMNIAIKSGDRSLRKYLEVFKGSENLLKKFENLVQEQGFNPENEQCLKGLSQNEKEQIFYLFKKISVLYSRYFGKELNEGDLKISDKQLVKFYNEIKKGFNLRDGKSIYNRLQTLLYINGLKYHSVEEVLQEMEISKRQAHERGLKLVNESKGQKIKFPEHAFLKGVDENAFSQIIQRGITSREYLGGGEDGKAAGSDATPFDIDGWHSFKGYGYGNINFVINTDKDCIYDSREEGTNQDARGKYELFKTGGLGEHHYGIRTGIPMTEVDYVIYTGDFGGIEFQNICYEIAKNGYYIPVTDAEGNIKFTPEMYNKMRQGFNYMGEYSGFDITENNGTYTVEKQDNQINKGKNNPELQSLIDENSPENPKYKEVAEENNKLARESLQKIREILTQECGITFNSEYDPSITGAEIYDSGSTGRGTDIPTKDVDLDFTLLLDAKDYERIDEITKIIHERIGTKIDNDHNIQEGGNQIKSKINNLGKSKERPNGIPLDLLILKKSQVIDYSSSDAMKEKLDNISKNPNSGAEDLNRVKTNIIIMKKLLKAMECYKKPEGGISGIGVENWILQNHGSFIEALESFEQIAYGGKYEKGKNPVSLKEFQDAYPIYDAGQNYKDGGNDNFAYKLNENGYNGTLKIIQTYRMEGIEGIKKLIKQYEDKKSEFINGESNQSEHNNTDYFGGKSQKIFEGKTENAESNSKFSDKILSEINEQNKTEKLEELRKEITEQYKKTTGEEVQLTDEQLLSILDAHEQDGKLGELTLGQLRVKVKILSESITNPKVRRFLLEAGFCGKNKEEIAHDVSDFITELLNNRDITSRQRLINGLKNEQIKKIIIEDFSTHDFMQLLQNDKDGELLSILFDEEGCKILSNSKNISERMNYFFNYSNARNKLFEKDYFCNFILNNFHKKFDIKGYINENPTFFNYVVKNINFGETGEIIFKFEGERQKQLVEKLDIPNDFTISNLRNFEKNSLEWLLNNKVQKFDENNDSLISNIRSIIRYGLRDGLEYGPVHFPKQLITAELVNKLFDGIDIFECRQLAENFSKNNDSDLFNEILRKREQNLLNEAYSQNGLLPKWKGLLNELNNFDFDGSSIRKFSNILEDHNIDKVDRDLLKKAYPNKEEILNIINKQNHAELSDIIIDYHFNDTSYNVFLDIKELVNFQLNNGVSIPKEHLTIYRNILNLDNLTIEEKINLHNKLKDINVIEIFYDDYTNSRDRMYQEISDSILNKEKIKHFENQSLSEKYGVPVYEFNGEEFFGLVRRSTITNAKPDTVGSSFSLVGKDCIGTISKPSSDTFLYEGLEPQQIIHVYPSDSYTPYHYRIGSNETSSNYVKILKSPSELLKETRNYNELFILRRGQKEVNGYENIGEIRPIALYCYDEITPRDIEVAKRENIGIMLINTDAYKKGGNSARYELDHNKEYIQTKDTFDEARKNRNERTSFDKMDELNGLIEGKNGNYNYLNGRSDNEGLIFDSKYIIQKDAGIYRFNTEKATNTQKNKPGYQSLQEAEQTLNNQIGGKYDKKLYQESFTKKHKNEDFEEDVDDFIRYATEKEVSHKQIFLDIAQKASARALFIGGPKKKNRIIEKVRNELLKEGKGLEAITDFTRATLLFDNFSDFEEGLKILEQMKNEGRILDLKIRNRLSKPGCNDIFVNIQTPDGYVSEVQFHIPEVLVFRDKKLGNLAIDRYKSDDSILDKHTLTKDIFDLSNDKYKRNLEAYNKIIDRLNEGRDKNHLLSLPKNQDQIVYDHDMYDIIRVLEVYENTDNLTLEDYESFTSKGFRHENIKDLLNDLRLMKENLCSEALNRYRTRTKQ